MVGRLGLRLRDETTKTTIQDIGRLADFSHLSLGNRPQAEKENMPSDSLA
jgi:hypothetical protein